MATSQDPTCDIIKEEKKRKITTPPDGYTCKLCQEAGHWIQQCPLKQKSKKKRKNDHAYVPGVDPSPQDIEKAKKLQQIPPPLCFCKEASRLKKVKRSHVNPDSSKAIGKYFFFCAKPKKDQPCGFAKAVDQVIQHQHNTKGKIDKPMSKDTTTQKKTVVATEPMSKICSFFAKKGTCKKGDQCLFRHERPVDNVSLGEEALV